MTEPQPEEFPSPELSRSPDEISPEPSTTSPTQTSPSSQAPRPPSLSSQGGSMAFAINPSSAPLGPTQAARRPGPLPSRASGLNSDIQAKMKAFSLSRQGAPSAAGARSGFP